MAFTPGLGTQLQVSIASVYTTIAQGFRVKAPGMRNDKAELLLLGQKTPTCLPTIGKWSSLEFSAWFDPAAATHQRILTQVRQGFADLAGVPYTAEAFKLIFADAGAADMTFSGYWESWDPGEARADAFVELAASCYSAADITLTP